MSRDKHPTQRLSTADRPARLALFGAISALVAASVVARMLLAPYRLNWASRVTHGSPTWMSIAGWATVAFAPAAALVLLSAGHSRSDIAAWLEWVSERYTDGGHHALPTEEENRQWWAGR